MACAPFAFCLAVVFFYYGTYWWGRSQAEKLLRDYEAAGHSVDPDKYWLPAANPKDDLFQDPVVQQELEKATMISIVARYTKLPSLARRLPRAEMGLARVTDLAKWVTPLAADDRTAAELLLKEHHAAVERLEALRPALSRSMELVWPVETSRDSAKIANITRPMLGLPGIGNAAADIALLHLAAGDAEKAAGAVQLMLDLIRLELGPKPAPFLIDMADTHSQRAERVIWEGVVRGSWSDDQLQAFERSLAALRPQEAAVKSHLGDIALLRSQTKWLLASTRPFPKIDIAWPRKWDFPVIWGMMGNAAKQFRPPGLILANEVESRRKFLEGTAYSGGKPRERFTPQEQAEFRRIADAANVDSIRLTGAGRLSYLAITTLRLEAVIAITRTGIALERYRLGTGGGSYPASLEALVPDFLPEVPMDPLGTQHLRYKLQADGSPQLWSVGGNYTDDGGLPHRDFMRGDCTWITRPIPGFTEGDLRR